MFPSIDDFLHYFDGVHRRALRDVGALPPAADGWRPVRGAAEKAWSINGIIGHMVTSRLYFASAYRGEGWIMGEPPDVSHHDRWLPALEESAAEFRAALQPTPNAWLRRKIPMIDTDGTLSGWRVLMLMVEHDIHHRSQLDTYAGLNGWDPPDIYGRTAEAVTAQRQDQVRKYRA